MRASTRWPVKGRLVAVRTGAQRWRAVPGRARPMCAAPTRNGSGDVRPYRRCPVGGRAGVRRPGRRSDRGAGRTMGLALKRSRQLPRRRGLDGPAPGRSTTIRYTMWLRLSRHAGLAHARAIGLALPSRCSRRGTVVRQGLDDPRLLRRLRPCPSRRRLMVGGRAGVRDTAEGRDRTSSPVRRGPLSDHTRCCGGWPSIVRTPTPPPCRVQTRGLSRPSGGGGKPRPVCGVYPSCGPTSGISLRMRTSADAGRAWCARLGRMRTCGTHGAGVRPGTTTSGSWPRGRRRCMDVDMMRAEGHRRRST